MFYCWRKRMARNNIIIAVQLLFSVCFLAYAQETGPKSLVSGHEDAVLYINSKQAEKEMDATLWKIIQEDKNKAIDSQQGDFVFDMKNRDLGVKLEFHLDQAKPLVFHIKGSADITGDIAKDMERLKILMSDDDDLKIIERKQGEKTLYSILSKENKTLDPWELSFLIEGSKVSLFCFFNRINITEDSQGKVSFTPDKRDFDFLQSRLFLDHSFVFQGNVRRLTPVLLDIGLSDKTILEVLKNLEAVYVTGKVKGEKLLFHINAKTIDVSIAAKYEEQLRPLVERFSSSGQSPTFVSSFNVKVLNASLDITLAIDLQPIWSFLSNTSPTLPVGKSMVHEDGDNDENE